MKSGRQNFSDMTFHAREIKGAHCDLCYVASFLRPALPPLVVLAEHPKNQSLSVKDDSSRLALAIYHMTPSLRSFQPETIEWAETGWIAHLARAKEENVSMHAYLKKHGFTPGVAKSLISVSYPIKQFRWHWEFDKPVRNGILRVGASQILNSIENAYLYFGGLGF